MDAGDAVPKEDAKVFRPDAPVGCHPKPHGEAVEKSKWTPLEPVGVIFLSNLRNTEFPSRKLSRLRRSYWFFGVHFRFFQPRSTGFGWQPTGPLAVKDAELLFTRPADVLPCPKLAAE